MSKLAQAVGNNHALEDSVKVRGSSEAEVGRLECFVSSLIVHLSVGKWQIHVAWGGTHAHVVFEAVVFLFRMPVQDIAVVSRSIAKSGAKAGVSLFG